MLNALFWVVFFYIMQLTRFYHPKVILDSGEIATMYIDFRILLGFPIILGVFLGFVNTVLFSLMMSHRPQIEKK